MKLRHIASFTVFAVLAVLSRAALAAPPVVEIVAMPHPPVKMALGPLREWMAAQGSRLKLKEIDSESAEGQKRMAAAGLTGHIPVLILIDGKDKHQRKDGTPVEFVNFPNQPNTPPGARGTWNIADVQAVLKDRIR